MPDDIFQLPVYSADTVITTIDTLLDIVDPTPVPGVTRHKRLFTFLNKAMHVPVPYDPEESSPLMLPLPRSDKEISLIALLTNMEDGSDISAYLYSETELKVLIGKVNEALEIIAKVYPNTYLGICALVGSFVFARTPGYGGGTSSNAIGVIWCGIQNPDIDIEEYVELILHEYMHQCLFIDDLCYRIFKFSMVELESFPARSAILNRMRPLDKSYHSAFVAYVLMQHRLKTSRRNLEHLKTTLECLASTRQQVRGLTDHGEMRLAELEHAVATLQQESTPA